MHGETIRCVSFLLPSLESVPTVWLGRFWLQWSSTLKASFTRSGFRPAGREHNLEL